MSWNALVTASTAVQAKAATHATNPWVGSPFAWLKQVTNVQRGNAARDIVENLLAGFGYKISAGKLAQSFAVKTHTVKVKLSMGWSGANSFKFQQIEDDPYTHLAMLGLAPKDAWLWICPRATAFQNAAGQHRTDSRWIALDANKAPAWLSKFGGNIATASATCLAQLGKP